MGDGTREKSCGMIHSSIEEAIVHAEQDLGIFREPAEPYYGTLRDKSATVVGFQVSSRKRWRLEFDPDPSRKKYVHVNEENFDAPAGNQRICHLVYSPMAFDTRVRAYYSKWNSRYGRK